MENTKNNQGKELDTLEQINEGLERWKSRSLIGVSGSGSYPGDQDFWDGKTPRTGSAAGASGQVPGADNATGQAPGTGGAAGQNPGTGGAAGQTPGASSAAGSASSSSRYDENGRSRYDRIILEQDTNGRGGARKSRSSRPRKKHGVLIALFIILLLLGAVAGLIFYFRYMGRQDLLEHEGIEGVEITAPEGAVMTDGGKKVTYNGKTYIRNDNVITILGMGIDRDSEEILKAEAGELEIGEKGQADTLFLAAVDSETGELNFINISREAMVDVDLYNTEGGFAGTKEMQICLAYAYGTDDEASCRNVIKSVSRLLYGMPIDAYASIDIPAISVLNDTVGGVEVNVLEDLSSRDPELVKGANVVLEGNQATTYLRYRNHDSADSNNARMQRQRQYVTNFVRAVRARAIRNISIVMRIYQAVQTYMNTDLDISRVVYLVSLTLEKQFSGANILNVKGDVVEGEEFAEYHVDEKALYELILKIFYDEVDAGGNIVDEPMTEEAYYVPQEEAAPVTQRDVAIDPTLLR